MHGCYARLFCTAILHDFPSLLARELYTGTAKMTVHILADILSVRISGFDCLPL